MDQDRFRTLPEPVRLEDTVTSEDVRVDEPTTHLVDAWLLKNAAG